jgi:protein-S-isoprenylcysteine O-methyltransferase Ste14
MRSQKTRITLNLIKLSAVLAVVLFTSAGTFRFWQAWLYLGLQIVTMAATNRYLLRNDPALLERRLALDETGEKDGVQKIVMGLSKLVFAALIAVSGIDRRLGWSAVPPAVVVAAGALFVAGTGIMFRVFRENTYGSSIIAVEAQQTVVATGPYRLVRHPMYVGALLMALATPLALGSTWAELLFPVALGLVVARLLAEERLLSEQLRGYPEYMKTTRARLIPGLW